jgi:predicted DNA-binding protein (MmcQ/YjbR family)
MSMEWVRTFCLALPGVTESVQWGADLVFKTGGRMFAVLNLEPKGNPLAFKCSDEDFAELSERPGIIPAPYMARAKWVALEHPGAMPAAEIKQKLEQAHALISAKLPKTKKAPPVARKGAARRGS